MVSPDGTGDVSRPQGSPFGTNNKTDSVVLRVALWVLAMRKRSMQWAKVTYSRSLHTRFAASF